MKTVTNKLYFAALQSVALKITAVGKESAKVIDLKEMFNTIGIPNLLSFVLIARQQ
jgi:hypothetical protein